MDRKDILKLSNEQKAEFAAKLQILCTEYGVIIDANSYCDTPYVNLTDKEGNWNVLQDKGNGIEILEVDFWEDE